MELDTLPASMIVIGGNAIGLEQAQLWNRLGVEVIVVEALDRLAPFEEPEVSAVIAEVFTREGIGVITGATITRTDRDATGYRVTLTSANGQPTQLRAEQLLVATGRRPNTAGLNLDAVGVKVGTRGEVVVDEHLRTDNPASGPPETSPATPNLSTSPQPTAPSWPTTPSTTRAAPWTTTTCPGSPSPAPPSPRPG